MFERIYAVVPFLAEKLAIQRARSVGRHPDAAPSASEEDASVCLYGTPCGNRCAVGWLVADEHYNQASAFVGSVKMLLQTIPDALKDFFPGGLTYAERSMLEDFQEYHDASVYDERRSRSIGYKSALAIEDYEDRKATIEADLIYIVERRRMHIDRQGVDLTYI